MYYNIRSGFVKDKTESKSFLPHLRCGCELKSNHKNAIASKHFYLCYNIRSGFVKDNIGQEIATLTLAMTRHSRVDELATAFDKARFSADATKD